jgi:RNA polymerase sigma factor (sigma-70 family)
VRRAEGGDQDSLGVVIARLSPILLAHANWRLGPALRRICDPEDIVSEAWATLLPRLGEIGAREGRSTPVLLRFLTTAMLYRINNLARKHLRGESAARVEADHSISELPASVTGAFEAAARSESARIVAAALDDLEPADREVIFLRALEQQPNHVVATLLSVSPQAVSMRYRRALDRLRARLPESVFLELLDD